MYRYLVLIISLVISAKCFAQSVSASDLDVVARSSKGTSIMFAQPLSEEDIAYQEEMKAREQYERAMREKEAYEQEMRARQEAMEKAEKERQRALRPVNLFGNSLKMYAVVNGEVITSRDMQDRANAFVATTQIPITSQNKQMVLERVLQGAVDEKIKLQEAKKNGIEITDQELNTGMQNFAKSNAVSVSEFKKMLKSAEVDEKAFKEQLKSEMAWARLVQSKASQSVKVSRSEVKKVIDSITRDTQKQKFMVSEIVIHKKDGAHISELVQILRQDPRFELYAMQFSQSATAKNGGSLGWVSSEQLVTQLSSKLAK
ncbi:MAG: SurA N-terminal domain-containing protein, partial [Alphaproteobacteria bacterium]|nr:SurA N-terminal domain-containing protein [Alphaproteobacteria bacterium]